MCYNSDLATQRMNPAVTKEGKSMPTKAQEL